MLRGLLMLGVVVALLSAVGTWFGDTAPRARPEQTPAPESAPGSAAAPSVPPEAKAAPRSGAEATPRADAQAALQAGAKVARVAKATAASLARIARAQAAPLAREEAAPFAKAQAAALGPEAPPLEVEEVRLATPRDFAESPPASGAEAPAPAADAASDAPEDLPETAAVDALPAEPIDPDESASLVRRMLALYQRMDARR